MVLDFACERQMSTDKASQIVEGKEVDRRYLIMRTRTRFTNKYLRIMILQRPPALVSTRLPRYKKLRLHALSTYRLNRIISR